jgi:hypothetical protein
MAMTSRERYMTTFTHKQPDRVPIDLQSAGSIKLPGVNPHMPLEEEIKVIKEWGGDPIVGIWLPPETPHPDVKIKKGICGKDEKGNPIRFARWETPAGTLEMKVRETDDWQDYDRHGHLENRILGNGLRDKGDWDLYLFDDWNCSRFIEPPIKTVKDVEALKYLLRLPSNAELAKWRQAAAVGKSIAEKYQCPIRARRTFGAEAGLWFMFTEDYLCATITNPEIVHAITNAVGEWQLKRAEVALDAGVDILMHRGWYETPDYFGGQRYNIFCRPLIEKLAKLCHQAGAHLTYQRTQGNSQSLNSIRDLPIDHLWGMEPGPGQEDMALLKRELGGRITLWGGVETTYTLNEGTPQQCRKVVKDAIETLASGGGFVIMPTAFATLTAPPENVKAAIQAAIELGKY